MLSPPWGWFPPPPLELASHIFNMAFIPPLDQDFPPPLEDCCYVLATSRAKSWNKPWRTIGLGNCVGRTCTHTGDTKITCSPTVAVSMMNRTIPLISHQYSYPLHQLIHWRYTPAASSAATTSKSTTTPSIPSSTRVLTISTSKSQVRAWNKDSQVHKYNVRTPSVLHRHFQVLFRHFQIL